MKGVAGDLSGVDLERGLEIFDRMSQEEIGNSVGTRRCVGISTWTHRWSWFALNTRNGLRWVICG